MKTVVFIGALLISALTFAQDTSKQVQPHAKKGFGVTVTQVQPEFPGGQESLDKFLKDNLAYPEHARLNHINGRVYVGFKIDYTGKILNPRILSSATDELDNEALRVVKMMPNWKPGTAGGSPVTVEYILPIDFITPPAITKQQ